MSDRTTASGPAWPAAAGGALLAVCALLAASSGRPDDLTVRSDDLAGTRLDVADLLERVPSWLTLLAASVGSTLLLLVTVPLLVLAFRALWQLLQQLAASARRPSARARRSRGTVRRSALPGGHADTGRADGGDRTRLRTALAGPAARAAEVLRDTADRDPGHEVIRSWEAVERAAAASGAARRPDQTPTEFTRALLQSLRVDDNALAALLDVYRRARFSRRPLTPAEVDRARSAFAVVAGQLRGGSGPDAAGAPR